MIALFAQLYVHVNYRLPYFNTAIKYLIIAQAYMTLLFYSTLHTFIALNNTCTLIYNYYAKLEEGKREPRADGVCTFTRIVYGTWFALIFASTVIRSFGLMLMLRARKFLKRKLLEKAKRKVYRREKKKKQKRQLKRNLQNLIEEKRNIMMVT